MRFATAVSAGAIAVVLSPAAYSRPIQTSTPRELVDVLPTNSDRPDQVTLTVDGQRTYFVNGAGEAWLFDRTRKTSARVASGPLWDLNLSAAGNAIAYTKAGDRRGDQFVWTLKLDPATGLAAGDERRLVTHQGDVPSISPDGKLVAFARDDASGVGQSVVVVPVSGGAERVVAAAIPSSLANIRWTPDGKTLYLGVNPPVACTPEWSCLPLTPDLRQPPATIRRVAVSGGEVKTVATGRSASPGLSPDGTTLAYQDGSGARQWIVASADGMQRDTLTLPSTQTPVAWLQGSTVLIVMSGPVPRLFTVDLTASRER